MSWLVVHISSKIKQGKLLQTWKTLVAITEDDTFRVSRQHANSYTTTTHNIPVYSFNFDELENFTNLNPKKFGKGKMKLNEKNKWQFGQGNKKSSSYY